MIEFTVRVCVDTQDVTQAYDELQASLQFIGHTCYIRDNWMLNHAPLPADTAQRVAYAWQKNRETLFNKGIIFTTNDPAFSTKLQELIESQEHQYAP
jgi:hypothetical protein